MPRTTTASPATRPSVRPFRITVCPRYVPGTRDIIRYHAVARTELGDRAAYGATHYEALYRALCAAWAASTVN